MVRSFKGYLSQAEEECIDELGKLRWKYISVLLSQFENMVRTLIFIVVLLSSLQIIYWYDFKVYYAVYKFMLIKTLQEKFELGKGSEVLSDFQEYKISLLTLQTSFGRHLANHSATSRPTLFSQNGECFLYFGTQILHLNIAHQSSRV